jgi:hypothetical protein
MGGGWQAYVIVDTSLFCGIAFYSIAHLIYAAVRRRFVYVARVFLRSIAFAVAFNVSISFLVTTFNVSQPGRDVFQLLTIALAVALCLSFFYSLHEWDALCRGISFHPCHNDAFMIIILLVIAMTGICQLCTYLIRTNASTDVFFFLNSLTLFVQLLFITGYGCFRTLLLLRALAVLGDTQFFACRQKFVVGMGAVLGPLVVLEFGSFVASFLFDLEKESIDHIFTVLCARIPMMAAIVSTLVFQAMMDGTAEHVVIVGTSTVEAPIV